MRVLAGSGDRLPHGGSRIVSILSLIAAFGGGPAFADVEVVRVRPGACRAAAEDLVREMSRAIAPVVEVVGHAPLPFHVSGWVEDGSAYRLSTGMVVDPSCFQDDSGAALTGTALDDRRGDFSRMHTEFLRALETCAGGRPLLSNPLKVYELLGEDPPRISCNPTACSEGASGCWAGSSGIRIRNRATFDASGLFHELLHGTEACDNQTTENHNLHTGVSDYRDEVTFWENLCFDPTTLFRGRATGARTDPCNIALNYHEEDEDPRYTSDEVGRVCGYLSTYQGMENRYTYDVQHELVPAAFDCPPTLSGCGDPAALSERLRRAVGHDLLVLPTRANAQQWLQDHCRNYAGNLFKRIRNAELRTCFAEYLDSVSTGFDQGASLGLYEEDTGVVDAVNDHLERLAAQVNYVADGPADVAGLPAAGPAYSGGLRWIERSLETCMDRTRGGGLADTEVCRLSREKFIPRQVEMYNYWGW